MKLLMFWLLLSSLVLSTSATSQMICNPAKCTNYTNKKLESRVTVSDPIDVVIINGSVPIDDGQCVVTLDFGDTYSKGNVIWSLSNTVEVNSTLQGISVIDRYKRDNVDNNSISVTSHFKIIGYTYFDMINSGQIESINFTADVNDNYKGIIRELLKNASDDKPNISQSGCSADLTVSLCPCKEPVITKLDLDDGVLVCEAVSLRGISMSITRNGTVLSDEMIATSEVFGTLTLQNVTVSETTDVTYTCTVTNDNGQVSRDYTVSKEDIEEKKSDQEDQEDHKDKIIIFVAVGIGSILAIVASCFGVIKCVEKIASRYKHTAVAVEDPDDDVQDDVGGEVRGEIRSAYSEADIVEMISGIGIYSEVKFEKKEKEGEEEEEDDEPNIYNHLDPNTRTFPRNDFRTLGSQPPTCLPPQPPQPPNCSTRFSPPAEDHYEMQTLKL